MFGWQQVYSPQYEPNKCNHDAGSTGSQLPANDAHNTSRFDAPVWENKSGDRWLIRSTSNLKAYEDTTKPCIEGSS